MNIIFQNWCGNGDLHLGRQFVKDIINKSPDNNFYYCHRQSKKTFKDIPKLDQNYSYDLLKEKLGGYYYDITTSKIDDDFFINTWIGQNNMYYFNIKQCSLYSYYELFKKIYNDLNISIESIEFYLPDIDYNYFYLDYINKYLNNNIENKKILVCNGPCMSGQYRHIDFNSIFDKLSDEHKDIHFIFTDDSDRINKDNIFYSSDIINTKEGDLNEISYLSTFCDIIIGRASGPYIFALVKENYKGKKFIAFASNYYDAVFFDVNGSDFKIFSNPNENVYEKIKDNI